MYIAFEGIDGSGKSTQARILCDALRRRNYAPIQLQEPTYGRHGGRFREQIAAGKDIGRNAQHDLLTADRREHVRHKIAPALELASRCPAFVLVQDRCFLSAPAYQASNSDDVFGMLAEQQEFAPTPDFMFILILPVETALKRKVRSGAHSQLFDDPSILQAVNDRYLLLADAFTEGLEVLDANQGSSEISRHVLDRIGLPPLE